MLKFNGTSSLNQTPLPLSIFSGYVPVWDLQHPGKLSEKDYTKLMLKFWNTII